jgi:pimeloyl-ACP methyl ester carboxylesterase
VISEADDGLAVKVRGSGHATVMWVHGYTLDATIWSSVWDLFPGWRHVAPDLPGHGHSRPVTRGETLQRLAASLVRIAHQYQARHLVGLSFGGMVALQMAIDAPLAFDTLTLSSPAVGGGPRDPGSRTRYLELTRLYRDRGAGPWMTELWMRSPPDIFRGASGHPELWRDLRAVIDRHDWAELGDERLSDLFRLQRQIQVIGSIQADTLVLVGEHDIPAFRRTAELIRSRIPRCARMYCPGAGHLCLLETPTAVAARVSAHLLHAT